MTTLEVFSETANLRGVPSAAAGAATVLAALPRGATVEEEGHDAADPSWVRVRAGDGTGGFMKRRLLRQIDPGPLAPLPVDWVAAYDEAVRRAHAAHEDVAYKLGAKRPEEGRVDCSGWIAFVNRLGLSAVNRAAGRAVFTDAHLRRLNTHSDHQVSLTGYRAGQIVSTAAVGGLPWRPGLLIGLDFGEHDWEANQGRVFGIDHVVQTMGSGGRIEVTQSSSGGHGVNRLPLADWLAEPAVARLRDANRLHVVDVFRLAGDVSLELQLETDGTTPLELEALDVAATPAG